MELPTSNRKKVIDIWLTRLVAKSTLFPFFRRSYLGNRLTYIAENLRRFFFKHYLQVCQISSKSEGGLANLAKNWLIWHGMTHMNQGSKLTLIRSPEASGSRGGWVEFLQRSSVRRVEISMYFVKYICLRMDETTEIWLEYHLQSLTLAEIIL